MGKLTVPIQAIMLMVSLAFNAYAERPGERITNSLGMAFVLIKPGKFPADWFASLQDALNGV